MAYDKQLGQALDYGQVGPPSNPKKPNSFLQWQTQTYGGGQQPKSSTTLKPGQPQVMAAPPPPEPSFMPNGQPQVNPAPAQVPQPIGSQAPIAPVLPPVQAPAQANPPAAATGPSGPSGPTLGAGLPTQYAGLESQLSQILQQLASNPTTMGKEQVAQLKGKSKDQAALMNKQNQGALRQALASRGQDVGSQFALNKQAELQGQSNSDLLGQYRDIDIGATQQNRNDILGVLGPLQASIYGAYGQQNWLDNMALQYQMLNNQQLASLFQ